MVIPMNMYIYDSGFSFFVSCYRMYKRGIKKSHKCKFKFNYAFYDGHTKYYHRLSN